ncbi:hypothetical protein PC9H_004456 [Pleurotus ostreatus]|uniref:Uncharacterized protein n=1 Tax=Pleurotus ostreatus TaxID=5322 RepID=A0A8H6ZV63_PLEOS|nr:uncharacterized protein PC9H_004456 [Pleurotus ostreatus]KAF7432515.1 hypothetical protein PC9H_004456 [Pleurotus ostreatus]
MQYNVVRFDFQWFNEPGQRWAFRILCSIVKQYLREPTAVEIAVRAVTGLRLLEGSPPLIALWALSQMDIPRAYALDLSVKAVSPRANGRPNRGPRRTYTLFAGRFSIGVSLGRMPWMYVSVGLITGADPPVSPAGLVHLRLCQIPWGFILPTGLGGGPLRILARRFLAVDLETMWAMEDTKRREPQNGFIVSHLAYVPAGWVFLAAEDIALSVSTIL